MMKTNNKVHKALAMSVHVSCRLNWRSLEITVADHRDPNLLIIPLWLLKPVSADVPLPLARWHGPNKHTATTT